MNEQLTQILFKTIDWESIPKIEHKGETGFASWQTVQLPGLRLRIVNYSAGYTADHWCTKGHVVFCVEGEFVSELQNGETQVMKKGMTYVVSDDASSHRSISTNGAVLFIIDGDFLKQ